MPEYDQQPTIIGHDDVLEAFGVHPDRHDDERDLLNSLAGDDDQKPGEKPSKPKQNLPPSDEFVRAQRAVKALQRLRKPGENLASVLMDVEASQVPSLAEAASSTLNRVPKPQIVKDFVALPFKEMRKSYLQTAEGSTARKALDEILASETKRAASVLLEDASGPIN